jgi:uncharacterized protein with HEPN domain
MVSDAVIRNFEIIGEAGNHIRDSCLRHPYREITWLRIRTGNKDMLFRRLITINEEMTFVKKKFSSQRYLSVFAAPRLFGMVHFPLF